MTGNLQMKNGKYYIVLNDYENGKRKQRWLKTDLPVKGNKRRAEQLLRETLNRYDTGLVCGKTDILFTDYIRIWLETARKTVDEVTYQGYEVLAKSQVLPYFDERKLRLQEVSRDDLQRYIDEKRQNGRKNGAGGLSAASLRLHKNILNQALKMAVKNELIPNNPCEFVLLPKQQRYTSAYYTAEQVQKLLDAIRNDPLYPLVRVTAFYGLRRSELLGLKWDSIDYENGLLTIKHTVSKVTKAVEKDKTKNASSYRSFQLTEEMASIFRDAKQREIINRRLFGKEYQVNDYVFKWDDGHLFSPDYVTRHFSKLLTKHELPHIRFHELRHSCASLLLNAGFTLKDVQEWMGHADIKMTANIYGHLDVARKKNIADKLTSSLSAAC